MLHRSEFDALYGLYKDSKSLCELGKDDKSFLMSKDFIDEDGITENGVKALESYKVDNAIIMAAGLSSRFAPLSYEKPKALLNVKGEILIERQIRQLKEAGIDDITVVVGYMKEQFYYLKDKFKVDIAVNYEYNIRNNNSTLFLVRDKLKNTYICSSDNYFTENVFEPYVYDSYYSAVFEKGITDEYCIKSAEDGRILDVKIGGADSWIMLGHVYFSRSFSEKFSRILADDYDKPGTDKLLWENIYINHIDELPMYKREYDKGIILEFDSLDDLRKFDESYKDHTGSKAIENICSTLKCRERDVLNIVPIKKKEKNVFFKFWVNGDSYVYEMARPSSKEPFHTRPWKIYKFKE